MRLPEDNDVLGIGCAATNFGGTAGTLWCLWLPDVFFSSPDAALSDDFVRSAIKATLPGHRHH
jgi:hypothetical protein